MREGFLVLAQRHRPHRPSTPLRASTPGRARNSRRLRRERPLPTGRPRGAAGRIRSRAGVVLAGRRPPFRVRPRRYLTQLRRSRWPIPCLSRRHPSSWKAPPMTLGRLSVPPLRSWTHSAGTARGWFGRPSPTRAGRFRSTCDERSGRCAARGDRATPCRHQCRSSRVRGGTPRGGSRGHPRRRARARCG